MSKTHSFIDEMNMIILRKIDLRLCRAIPSSQDEPFGRLFIYFQGYIRQLPPVNNRPLYSDKIQGSEFLLEENQYLHQVFKSIFSYSLFYENMKTIYSLF